MPDATDPMRAFLADRRIHLTDGGFETSMLFHEGFDLPAFSAAPLLDDARGRGAMRAYFDRYLGLAEAAGTGFVLDTNTWRAGPHWAGPVGVSEADILRLNRDAVAFAREIRADWAGRVDPILVNGVVGPAGDGYATGAELDPARAEALHAPQIRTLAAAGVDLVSALTMTHAGEAAGIARAAVAAGRPVVISFTVETDGRLPNGQALSDAIAEVDAETGGAPLYYMVNCAHPDHFAGTLAGDWVRRIGGVRANASRLSHAELDEAEELDTGDPEEWGALHRAFAGRLPNLRVLGGCCGTDHRHVGCASAHLIETEAA